MEGRRPVRNRVPMWRPVETARALATIGPDAMREKPQRTPLVGVCGDVRHDAECGVLRRRQTPPPRGPRARPYENAVESGFARVGAWLSLVEHSVRDRGV